MADFIQTASDWFHEQRTLCLAQTMEYRKCGKHLVDGGAGPITPGFTFEEVDDSRGHHVRSRRYDFTIGRELLVHNGESFDPKKGDTITWQINGWEIVYKVQNSGSEPGSIDHDRYMNAVRVHTVIKSRTKL